MPPRPQLRQDVCAGLAAGSRLPHALGASPPSTYCRALAAGGGVPPLATAVVTAATHCRAVAAVVPPAAACRGLATAVVPAAAALAVCTMPTAVGSSGHAVPSVRLVAALLALGVPLVLVLAPAVCAAGAQHWRRGS